MPDGRAFKDIKDFKKHLLDHPTDVQRCLTEKLLTYATGAAPTYADKTAIADIIKNAQKQGGGLQTYITELIISPTFRSK